MCNHKTKRFSLVEVDCMAQNETSLKDEELLRKAKRVVAISAYRVGNMSHTPTGRPVASDTVFKKSYLIITDNNGTDVLKRIPFVDLDRQANAGLLYLIDIPNVAPTQCKVAMGDTTGVSANESWLLGFFYE